MEREGAGRKREVGGENLEKIKAKHCIDEIIRGGGNHLKNKKNFNFLDKINAINKK